MVFNFKFGLYDLLKRVFLTFSATAYGIPDKLSIGQIAGHNLSKWQTTGQTDRQLLSRTK